MVQPVAEGTPGFVMFGDGQVWAGVRLCFLELILVSVLLVPGVFVRGEREGEVLHPVPSQMGAKGHFSFLAPGLHELLLVVSEWNLQTCTCSLPPVVVHLQSIFLSAPWAGCRF